MPTQADIDSTLSTRYVKTPDGASEAEYLKGHGRVLSASPRKLNRDKRRDNPELQPVSSRSKTGK